jgi:hypothetical protein
MESLREIFFKIDRIHSFDVRCWTFDVRCSSVSFSIKLAAFQAIGWAILSLLIPANLDTLVYTQALRDR